MEAADETRSVRIGPERSEGSIMTRGKVRWPLVIYDVLILLAVDVLLLGFYRSNERLSWSGVAFHTTISFICVFSARCIGNIYQQIWRYGGIQCYIRLLLVDAGAFLVFLAVEQGIQAYHPIEQVTFARLVSISSINLLMSLSMRMFYRYAFKCGTEDTVLGRFLRICLRIFAGEEMIHEVDREKRTKVAIIGAGRVGVNLAEELLGNSASSYVPRCFVDSDDEKAGKEIHGIPVWKEDDATVERLHKVEVQEVVFAIPNMTDEKKRELCKMYMDGGFKVKVYDYPVIQTAGQKRHLRDFDIEELLFRKPITISNQRTSEYYRDKVVLITGGGGSIGSELCRQLAKMEPRQIILLDIYENGVYDIQQELKIAYGNRLDLQLEICSITNRKALERVFARYSPQIVINAAAHKHVPLMEKNCVEAVYNNVFGTRNLIDCCEAYGAERMMMVSTDKAVNPTNVMGATKRMCEMLVQSAATWGRVNYSATRFGNVLGSAGSVIPLFRRQIAAGGPVTLTDKRIIRYFMTIPEASQLVLESGPMAKNGELFVLDMGQPVKILELAENMIRLSGAQGVEIVETGLRPGEKLYEELLVKTEELDKTDNSLIFIEKDCPLPREEMNKRMELLARAVESGSDAKTRKALKQAVPTFRSPEEVNASAEQAEEMKMQREAVCV